MYVMYVVHRTSDYRHRNMWHKVGLKNKKKKNDQINFDTHILLIVTKNCFCNSHYVFNNVLSSRPYVNQQERYFKVNTVVLITRFKWK